MCIIIALHVLMICTVSLSSLTKPKPKPKPKKRRKNMRFSTSTFSDRNSHKLVHIAIMSTWNDQIIRNNIRTSWLKFEGNYSYTFIVGQPQHDSTTTSVINANKKGLTQLNKEMKRYNDILMGNFIDSYYNLTRKAVTMLSLRNKADYLFKADTDTYVNIPHLLRYIKMKRDRIVEYAGRLVKTLYPDRDSKARWYMPYSSWPNNSSYPEFAQGQGYLIKSSLANCMSKVVDDDWPDSRLDFPLEDVFVGILANKCKAKTHHLVTLAQYVKIHDENRNTNVESAWLANVPGDVYKYWIFAHRLNEAQILTKLLERSV